MAEQTKKVTTVHHVLAGSYATFFIGLVIGILISSFYDKPISTQPLQNTGIIFIIVGTVIILLAQSASRKGYDYSKGLFKALKYPTHLGLLFLVVGYAFIDNSVTILISAFAAAIFSALVFIPKYRKFLNL